MPAHAIRTLEHRQGSSHAGSCHSHTGTPAAEFPRRLMPFAHWNTGSGVSTPAHAIRTPEHRQRSFHTAHGVAHVWTPAAELYAPPCHCLCRNTGSEGAHATMAFPIPGLRQRGFACLDGMEHTRTSAAEQRQDVPPSHDRPSCCRYPDPGPGDNIRGRCTTRRFVVMRGSRPGSENIRGRCTTLPVVVIPAAPCLAEDFLRFVRRAHLLSLTLTWPRPTTFRVSSNEASGHPRRCAAVLRHGRLLSLQGRLPSATTFRFS